MVLCYFIVGLVTAILHIGCTSQVEEYPCNMTCWPEGDTPLYCATCAYGGQVILNNLHFVETGLNDTLYCTTCAYGGQAILNSLHFAETRLNDTLDLTQELRYELVPANSYLYISVSPSTTTALTDDANHDHYIIEHDLNLCSILLLVLVVIGIVLISLTVTLRCYCHKRKRKRHRDGSGVWLLHSLTNGPHAYDIDEEDEDSSVGEREHGEEPLIQDSKMNDRLGLDISEEEKNSTCEERLGTEITNCGTISTVRHNTENTAGSHVGHCTPSREDKEIQQRASQSTKTRESQIRADIEPTLSMLSSLESPNGERIHIIKSLAPNWQRLGRLMDFDRDGTQLECIRKDNRSPEDCCAAMFQHWLKGNGHGPTSWDKLIELLKHCDEKRLARKIMVALSS